MKICPFCGEEIPDNAEKCPICNEVLNISKEKTCPYCKEKITEDVTVCPACGESLQSKKINIKLGKNCKKYLLIVIAVLLALLGITQIISRYETLYYKANVSYFEELNISQVVNFGGMYGKFTKLSSCEKDILKPYLEAKHLKQNKDKIFLAYYETLLSCLNKFNEINASNEDSNGLGYYLEYSNQQLANGKPVSFGYEHGQNEYGRKMRFTPIMGKAHDEYSGEYMCIKEIKITEPDVPQLKISYSGEGVFEAELNYGYLYNTYAKYLGSAWKDYLSIKSKEQKDLDSNTYYIDGALNPSMHALTEWIIAWQTFSKKYPKFMTDKIEKDLRRYTADFMVSTYRTFDYSDDRLIPEAKKSYEAFLKKVNSNTKEYKIVNKCYSLLKLHDYKANDEFYACVSEYENKENDWNWY
ncbi:MAG: zinc ribbon domain-containing protein [Candidatus Gastranaerophilales bacterium]|nr:zinc ribbon domain-containing protein [Candidatus Gastranaerophilales bacterium]MCM1338880.1 zinc ribbon domain-containing protein [Muribaculaceae bacterium]